MLFVWTGVTRFFTFWDDLGINRLFPLVSMTKLMFQNCLSFSTNSLTWNLNGTRSMTEQVDCYMPIINYFFIYLFKIEYFFPV